MLKVTIYQRSVEDSLTAATIKKLAAMKSDFLVLPEYFFGSLTPASGGSLAPSDSRPEVDWLLRLSDAYRGVIIGGSMLIEENGSRFVASPIVSEGNVIDWYRKRRLGPLDSAASPGQDPGVFILAGHRFGTLLGEDLQDRTLLAELADMGIRLIFAPIGFGAKPAWDSSELEKAVRELGLYMVCCSGAGAIGGHALWGRSMMITPDGVGWRVSEQEAGNEIVKAVMFALKG